MIIFKSNVACIEQINTCFIKSDNTKDIAPKFFFQSTTTGTQTNNDPANQKSR